MVDDIDGSIRVALASWDHMKENTNDQRLKRMGECC